MNDKFRRFLNSPYGMLIIIIIIVGPLKQLINGGLSGLASWIVSMLYMIPAIIVAMSVHEYAHAKVADLCGDPTPKYNGRVTMDPRAHVDLGGLLSLLFIGFGWGKPVVINPANFKNKRRDSIFVGLAGVTANFLMAFAFGFIIALFMKLSGSFYLSSLGQIIMNVLIEVVALNISLMLFNLIPVPPLDGFGVICELFNLTRTKFCWYAKRYSSICLLILIALGIPSLILSKPLNGIVNWILRFWINILY